jgi:Spy/CpxP family protein refolding chaperone
MKRILIVAVLGLFVLSTAISVTAGGKEGHTEKTAEVMKESKDGHRQSLVEQLALSEDQVGQLEALKSAYMAQVREYKAAFSALLSEDQLAVLAEASGQKRKPDLDLSEDQKVQIEALGIA